MDYTHIITIESGNRSGQPCIRGMRITVRDVLEYLAGGMTVAELLDEFPELTADDVRACYAFAAAQSALALPEAERLELVEALPASRDSSNEPPFDPAWLSEIRRRSAEIDAGTVRLDPWPVVRDRVRQRLAGRSRG